MEVSDLSKFEWSKQNAICFDIIVPEELGHKRFEIMQEQMSIYYGYQSKIEERVMSVKVLQRIKGSKISIPESKKRTKAQSNETREGFSMIAETIEKLANYLESKIHFPIVNETNLAGFYDIEIAWYNENPKQIHEELKKIGLEIVDAERKIEVLVIKDK